MQKHRTGHHPNFRDLTGKTFGRLRVQSYAGQILIGKRKRTAWACLCACGTSKTVSADALNRGNTRSCGCLIQIASETNPRNTKHGMNRKRHRTPEYRAWEGMKRRCKEQKTKDKKNYTDRGITVCDRWNDSFEAFYTDVGPRPGPGYTIDRKDNNRGYEPGNVRWATYSEQNNNKRCSRFIEFCGQVKTITEWALMLGGSANLIRERLRCGWTIERAITTPLRK